MQQSLNCLAKDNSIYIVANTGAGSPTVPVTLSVLMVVVTNTTTDVVFDSEGGLVARYCKVRISSFAYLWDMVCIYTLLLNVGETTIMNEFLNYYVLVEQGVLFTLVSYKGSEFELIIKQNMTEY